MSQVFVTESKWDQVVEELANIPLKKRVEMRRAISENAHKMQYATGEPAADKPDAFNVIADHVGRGQNEDDATAAMMRANEKFEKYLANLENEQLMKTSKL